MPYCIRHKETGQIMKMRSGKSVWAQKGHAKAAYKTSGCYMKVDGLQKLFGGWRCDGFDKQDIFEIVEAEVKTEAKRYRFMRDYENHNYLIPEELTLRFFEELEKDWEDSEFDVLFDQYRIDSISDFTFENPKEV